jgi:hypothetical protein
MTLPWLENPIIFTSLIAFLILSLVLFGMNLHTVIRMVQGNQTKQFQTGVIRSRLNWLQLFGAGMHVLNQTYFLIQLVGRHLPCSELITMGGAIFSCMVLSVSMVLIQRSTTLFRGKKRYMVRAFLSGLVVTGVSFIVASNAKRTWNEERVIRGACAAIWNRPLNAVGKVFLIIMYIFIMLSFLRPLLR